MKAACLGAAQVAYFYLFAGFGVARPAFGSPASWTESMCGRLESTSFIDEGGRTYPYFLLAPDGQGENETRLRMLDQINARFVGNRVCLSHVSMAGNDADRPAIAIDDLSQVTLQGGSAANYAADNCEIFIDKIVPVFTFHQLSPYGSYSSLALRVYLKILPERLDAPIASVRFYGYDHYDARSTYGEMDLHFAPAAANAFVGAADYYQFDDVAPLGAWRAGAFYVETTRGTRYWLNSADHAFANFVFDTVLLTTIEEKVGWFGQRTDPPDGYIRPEPEAIPFQVDRLAKTADAIPYLNPATCR